MNDVFRNGTRETCPVCGDDYTVELPHNCPVVADLEQQLADVGSINLRLMEKLAELRKAAQAVVDSEGVVYPIPASHSYKVATLKAALEVDSGS